MKDFSTISNTSGAFPSVVATNSSGPTLRDGTPITVTVLNDIWGAFQAILDAASVTPSGSVESSSASDLLDSIRKTSGSPGELVWHAAPSETGLDANILPLKGQVITIASYPDLVAATYIGDANNANTVFPGFYKTSDALGATRNTAGPYFVLPDARGKFLRALANDKTGVDEALDAMVAAGDPEYKYMSGTWELEAVGTHTHDIETNDPAGQGLERETQYVLTSDPGNVTGADAVVTPVARTMYPIGSGASYDLGAKISGAGDYYSEVRPSCLTFQLGIRY